MGYSIGNGKDPRQVKPSMAPRPLDPTNLASSGLIAHYKFNGDLTDSSGNGYDLSVAAGAAAYAPDGPGGLKCISFQGGTRLILANSAHNSAFQVITDLTIVCLLRRHDFATHAQSIVECSAATSGSAGEDWPFYLKLGLWNSSTFNGGLYGGWKYNLGATPVEMYGNGLFVSGDWALVRLVRTFDGTNPITQAFGVNGRASGSTSPLTRAYADRPQSAASSILSVGGALAGGGFLKADMAGLAFISGAVSDDTFAAEAARIGLHTPGV